MDLNDYWQENKRFLVSIGVGLLVFLIGSAVVESSFGADLRKATVTRSRHNRSLREGRYGAQEKRRAEARNAELEAALAALGEAAAFRPRPEFVLRADGGSASNQYFGAVDRVREELGVLRSRFRASLPDGLGLEPVKTQSAETILRHLEALDLLDRAARCALEAGVRNVTKIRVELDPAFDSRGGLGPIERTRVEVTVVAASEAVGRMLAASQSDRYGQPLAIERFEAKSSSNKLDEVKAEVTFLVVRLRAAASSALEEI